MAIQTDDDCEDSGSATQATSPAHVRRRVGAGAPPLRSGDGGNGTLTTGDPLSLIRALESSGRFRRDTNLGGIFHHGKISYRELVPRDSLHVIVKGNRVSAHIDVVSPLRDDAEGPSRYAWNRVLAHNLSDMAADLSRRLRGLHGRQRCHLDCEMVWVDDDSVADLLASPEAPPTDAVSPDAVAPDAVAPDAVATSVATADAGTGDAQAPSTSDGPGRSAAPARPPVPSELPFSLIDEAVHLLDTEAAPWSVQVEVRVGGSLDEARLRQALARAMGVHPMARARKSPSRRSLPNDRWSIPPSAELDALRVLDCPDDAALAKARSELQSLVVPLAESPPLRMRLVRHPGGDLVMLNVNHAVMDGFGAMRVLQSVARAYAGDDELPPTLDFLEARELPVRLAFADTRSRRRRNLMVAARLRDLVVPPARLAPDGQSNEAGYGFHHVSLSGSETEALLVGGAEAMNDLLVAALHLTIARWNAAHGAACGRIGVLVPADLRPRQWRDDMVGNFSLPGRVSTSRRARRDPPAAQRAVAAQTRSNKSSGIGTALIEVLGRSPLFPVWAKQAMVLLLPLTGNRLVDTAMLCDLGTLAEAPWFGPDAGEVREVWFSLPARMPLGLTVGAVTAAGRLHLAFRYRHRLFGPDAARRFADDYLHVLGDLPEPDPETPGVCAGVPT